MFTIYNNRAQKVPLKIWQANRASVEESCIEQALAITNHPAVYKHVALMPDCGLGYGLPIGGVVALEDAVSPGMVDTDIGCGMIYQHTNTPARLLRETSTPNGTLLQSIIGSIRRAIPVGFSKHRSPLQSNVIDLIMASYKGNNMHLIQAVEESAYSMGTLGGGNHFLELQEDLETGEVGIMVHSGSRHLGGAVAMHFMQLAKELNEKESISIPSKELSFLPASSPEGMEYLKWMNYALDFAEENRLKMLYKVREIMLNQISKYTNFTGFELGQTINTHHNYASLEEHYGKKVWVHRKGAISAATGELGIIPGAMGSFSYIVQGRGNPESFYSASHGAGRKGSRSWANEEFTVQEMMLDLKRQGVVLSTPRKDKTLSEYRLAYKDIEDVISQEMDLVTPLRKLKTLGVVKG